MKGVVILSMIFTLAKSNFFYIPEYKRLFVVILLIVTFVYVAVTAFLFFKCLNKITRLGMKKENSKDSDENNDGENIKSINIKKGNDKEDNN